MGTGRFCTAINCMDGRVQEPVAAWARRRFGADYVDTVTEPGPEGILAAAEPVLTASIMRRVRISVEKHHSLGLVIAAHGDCARNPVSREEHLRQLREAVTQLRRELPPLQVQALWLEGPEWAVEEVV